MSRFLTDENVIPTYEDIILTLLTEYAFRLTVSVSSQKASQQTDTEVSRTPAPSCTTGSIAVLQTTIIAPVVLLGKGVTLFSCGGTGDVQGSSRGRLRPPPTSNADVGAFWLVV